LTHAGDAPEGLFCAVNKETPRRLRPVPFAFFRFLRWWLSMERMFSVAKKTPTLFVIPFLLRNFAPINNHLENIPIRQIL
jgi:hypothetical protein